MKQLLAVLSLCLFPGCPFDPVPSPTPPPSGPGYDCANPPTFVRGEVVPVANAIAGRYLVVLKSRPVVMHTLSTAEVKPLTAVMGVTEVQTTGQGYAAKLAASALSRILADSKRPDSNILYIQQEGTKSIPKPQPAIAPAALTTAWNLDRIDQRDLPLDGDYDHGPAGTGVSAAIIDTGISAHSEFEDRLAIDCFTAHGSSCADGHGHGTHVAGTVGSKTWGVAKKVNLYAVRVLDSSGSGSDSDVIRGIEWVAAKKTQNPLEQWVANMSLGGSPSPALDQAVCDAMAVGVVFAVAAGNESDDAATSSPARVRQVITVAASDMQDRQPEWSNDGALIDVFAPGSNVQSLKPGGGTDTMSGTSMATPAVAGAAVLYLQRHPGTSPAEVAAGIVASATTDKISNPGDGTVNRLLYVKEP